MPFPQALSEEEFLMMMMMTPLPFQTFEMPKRIHQNDLMLHILNGQCEEEELLPHEEV
jgi:hypothetical protein